MQTHRSTAIRAGCEVHAAGGERIGRVAETSPNYFVIERGRYAATDLFVPMSAIAVVRGDRIELRFTRDELEDGHFTAPIGPGSPSSASPAPS